MRNKPKRKKDYEEDWIYDPVIAKGILDARKEVEEAIKKGIHLHTMEEILEEFHKEDEKKIRH